MADQGGAGAGAGAPATTIVPFNNQQLLPACAAACGPLYDANGACVPPQVAADAGPTAYTQCFCSDTRVAAFSTATAGVCDNACTADPKGLSSIAGWFRNICSVTNTGGGTKTNTGTGTATATDDASSTAGSRLSNNDGGGGDWLSNHWQWVIFIVVLVVGIAAIWVGACIWRRRYLRRKDRQSSLGQKHSGSASRPSWGPGMEASESGGIPYDNGYDDSNRGSNGIMLPGVAAGGDAPVEEKPKKKRWIVRDRT